MLKTKRAIPVRGDKPRVIGTQSDGGVWPIIANIDNTTYQQSASGHEFHVYQPIVVEKSCTATHIIYSTGSGATGYVDYGIFNSSGVRLVSFGSLQAVGTASSAVITAITPTLLVPGRYYLASAWKGAGGIGYYNIVNYRLSSLTGVYQQSYGAGATPALPVSVDFSTLTKTATYIPIVTLRIS